MFHISSWNTSSLNNLMNSIGPRPNPFIGICHDFISPLPGASFGSFTCDLLRKWCPGKLFFTHPSMLSSNSVVENANQCSHSSVVSAPASSSTSFFSPSQSNIVPSSSPSSCSSSSSSERSSLHQETYGFQECPTTTSIKRKLGPCQWQVLPRSYHAKIQNVESLKQDLC